jgi:hypothetical protein
MMEPWPTSPTSPISACRSSRTVGPSAMAYAACAAGAARAGDHVGSRPWTPKGTCRSVRQGRACRSTRTHPSEQEETAPFAFDCSTTDQAVGWGARASAGRRDLPGKGVVRRAGSASRRVAARSGFSWDPGLPRPDARLTLTPPKCSLFPIHRLGRTADRVAADRHTGLAQPALLRLSRHMALRAAHHRARGAHRQPGPRRC